MQFIDLAAQQARLRERIDARIAKVLDEGQYIMGPEVTELEDALRAFCGATQAITCANGTDALHMVLMALGVGAGDAILCPAFTFAATAEVAPLVGAVPFFVDCDPATFNMDPDSLVTGIAQARAQGLRPVAVVAVDLFGLPADYARIEAIANDEGLIVISDSAQGFGSSYHGRKSGTLGHVTTTSFFPAKPLGCYGDGGAIFTNDAALADTLRSLRQHGKGDHKYDNARIGVNSRLDTIQAAILCEKLAVFADEIDARNRIAQRYSQALGNVLRTPHVPEGLVSTWAQYTLVTPENVSRDAVIARLSDQGVPSAVYYPRPVHQQTAYAEFPHLAGGLPVSESLAGRVFSLPMHPYLTEEDQDQIIEAVHASLG